jgi:septin family protein
LSRKHAIDNTVYCCFYFISAFGHGLKPLGMMFMKVIYSKVSIVPVVANANPLSLMEWERLKKGFWRKLKNMAQNPSLI